MRSRAVAPGAWKCGGDPRRDCRRVRRAIKRQRRAQSDESGGYYARNYNSVFQGGPGSRVGYRVIVCEPKPMRSATRNEGMLFVLLVPFARPFRSCMAKV